MMTACYLAWAMTKVLLEPSFVIHQRAYGETSVIVDIFTLNYGRMSLLAKGVKGKTNKNNRAAQLQYFSPLQCSWSGRSDLKTMTDVESQTSMATLGSLQGERLFSGFYINELIYYLLKPQDPHPELFQYYLQCLQQLPTSDLEPLLRVFEIHLLQQLGYGINFFEQGDNGQPIEANGWYFYNNDDGFHRVSEQHKNAYAGQQLLQIGDFDFDQVSLRTAKKLLRTVINGLLNGRQLHSRKLFANTQLSANAASHR